MKFKLPFMTLRDAVSAFKKELKKNPPTVGIEWINTETALEIILSKWGTSRLLFIVEYHERKKMISLRLDDEIIAWTHKPYIETMKAGITELVRGVGGEVIA